MRLFYSLWCVFNLQHCTEGFLYGILKKIKYLMPLFWNCHCVFLHDVQLMLPVDCLIWNSSPQPLLQPWQYLPLCNWTWSTLWSELCVQSIIHCHCDIIPSLFFTAASSTSISLLFLSRLDLSFPPVLLPLSPFLSLMPWGQSVL